MDAIAAVTTSEARLLAAMLAGDADRLDGLIDDRVVFTGPDGTVLSKHDDLAAHRSGQLRLTRLETSDSRLFSIDAVVVSTCKAQLEGTFAGEDFSGRFAYTRVWAEHDGAWRVIAAQASAIG